jgi:hypothetical protein
MIRKLNLSLIVLPTFGLLFSQGLCANLRHALGWEPIARSYQKACVQLMVNRLALKLLPVTICWM